MKIYTFMLAPNPTKVRLYLAEKRAAGAKVVLDEETVSLLEGEQKKPEHQARNPYGKLPVLELDDGTFIHESLAIIEYLEELHPEPSLYGPNPSARALGRQTERIADLGVLIPIAKIVHATKSPLGLPPNPEIADYHRSLLPPHLDHLEGLLKDGRPFLMGDSVTVADCTLAAGLQFGRFRELTFLDGHPTLAAWDARFRVRETASSVLVV